MLPETEIALRNYDYMIREGRGLDDTELDWRSGTLVYGDGGMMIDELTRPGLTPATGDRPHS